MSVPVAIDQLDQALADFGAGYLLTTADGRVKVVSVVPVLDDGVLCVHAPGRGSVANVGANPVVTLLFAPSDPAAMSLLVDGTATVRGDDVVVTPTGAVLHKAAHR